MHCTALLRLSPNDCLSCNKKWSLNLTLLPVAVSATLQGSVWVLHRITHRKTKKIYRLNSIFTVCAKEVCIQQLKRADLFWQRLRIYSWLSQIDFECWLNWQKQWGNRIDNSVNMWSLVLISLQRGVFFLQKLFIKKGLCVVVQNSSEISFMESN